MRVRLVWFRRDLRMDDHLPLAAAAATGDAVVGVYIACPRQWGAEGFAARMGPVRARFVADGLADLRHRLRRCGTDLLIRHGRVDHVLAELVASAPAHAPVVAVHHADEPDAPARDEARRVAEALAPSGVPVHTVDHGSMVPPADLPFDAAGWPATFTAFRRAVESTWVEPSPVPAPAWLPAPPPDGPWGVPGDLPEPPRAEEAPADAVWTGGETAGELRWHGWVWQRDGVATYRATRDQVMGEDASSRMSPYLAQGMASPRRLAADLARYEAERGATEHTAWFRLELLWRDYFRGWARAAGRRVFSIGGVRGLDLTWRHDEERFEAWRTGRTGYPLVDAAMRELLATGWTTNRSRQNVASFLTKALGEDWRRGAIWFENQLVDADVASNWGNWQYVAGVGNDPRGWRVFDVVGQARRHDPDGAFIRRWVPELADAPAEAVHAPDPLHHRAGYPAPIVDWSAAVADHERAYRAATRRR